MRLRIADCGLRNSEAATVRASALPLAFSLILVGCGQSEVDRLLDDLKSPDTATRRVAVQRLAEQKPPDDRVVSAFTLALADPDLEVRRWSCRGLGELGAASAQNALEERLKDEQVSVRRAAAFALQRVAPDSTAYRKELLDAMRTGDGGVIVALAKCQPPPTWAADTLIELLKDRRPGIRRLAAEALGQIGTSTASAQAALENATRDPDDRVRESATAALGRLRK